MAEQSIYFDDLKAEVQEEIKTKFKTDPDSEYWDLFPLVVLKNKEPEKTKE